jgi:hypothetical protein
VRHGAPLGRIVPRGLHGWSIALGLSLACAAPPDTDGGITLSPLVTVGVGPDSSAFDRVPVVGPLLRGGYHVIFTDDGPDDRPRVYDAQGRFLRFVAGVGAGPDELARVDAVHRSGDTALIRDAGTGRMLFFLPPDSIVRRVPWGTRALTLLELADGSFVTSAGIAGRRPPLTHWARDGRVLAEFGDVPTDVRRDMRAHELIRDPRGGFWSRNLTQAPVFVRWDAPGELRDTLVLPLDWFRPEEHGRMATPDVPPGPLVLQCWLDDEGMLWIVGAVADPEWRRALGAMVRLEGQDFYPVTDPHRRYDTVIERWDPATRQRLASRRVDAYYGVPIEPWVMGRPLEDADGFVRVELVRVSLR